MKTRIVQYEGFTGSINRLSLVSAMGFLSLIALSNPVAAQGGGLCAIPGGGAATEGVTLFRGILFIVGMFVIGYAVVGSRGNRVGLMLGGAVLMIMMWQLPQLATYIGSAGGGGGGGGALASMGIDCIFNGGGGGGG